MTTEDEGGLDQALVSLKKWLEKMRKDPKNYRRRRNSTNIEDAERSIAVLEDIQRVSQGRGLH
jgi:hypothetical protein